MTLPDRLYAGAVQNDEMLLSIPLWEPQQSSDLKIDRFALRLGSYKSF
jgi:hypothetical protein